MREREQPMTQNMKAMEARQQWSRILNQVFKREKRVVVEKSGVPVAAVVSMDDLRQLQRLEEQRSSGIAVLQRSWDAFQDVDPDSIEHDVAAAVVDARADLRKEASRGS